MQNWRKQKNSRVQTTILFLLVGLMLFIPFMSLHASGNNLWESFWTLRYSIPFLFFFVGGFLMNYYVLVPYLFIERKYTQYALGVVLTFALMSYLCHFLSHLIIEEELFVQWMPSLLPLSAILAYYGAMLFLNILLILAAISLRSSQYNNFLYKEQERLEKVMATDELARLKGQLNPHFLFNTLNNISSLSAFDPDATQTSIARLSEMLRYVLYESSEPKVALQKDLHFMENYIDLMNIRYEDTLKLDVQLQTAHPEWQIPPMLFISLLENAYKYGASSLHKCQINVKLEEQEEGLTFTVGNTLLTESEMQSKKKGGVGLVNLEKRLELLFPGKHKLTYGVTGDGYYEAKLELTIG